MGRYDTNSSAGLTAAQKTQLASASAHSSSAHAPQNAEPNNLSSAHASELTGGGETTLHSHAGGGGAEMGKIRTSSIVLSNFSQYQTQEDAAFTWTLEPGLYKIDGSLRVTNQTGVDNGLKLRLTVPTASTHHVVGVGGSSAKISGSLPSSNVESVIAHAHGTMGNVLVSGVLKVANTGTFQIRYGLNAQAVGQYYVGYSYFNIQKIGS